MAHQPNDGCLTLCAKDEKTAYKVTVAEGGSAAPVSNESTSVLRSSDGTYTTVTVTTSCVTNENDAFVRRVLRSLENNTDCTFAFEDFPYHKYMSPEVWQHVYGKMKAPL